MISKRKRLLAGVSTLGLIFTMAVAGFLAPANAATLTFNPTADTYVQYDRPTENFGTSVRWSTEGRANIWRNALVRFNVVLPQCELVSSAKFRAYAESHLTDVEFVDIYGTTGAWTETGVTWNNAPARGTWLGKQGNFYPGEWVEWDVTSWVGANGGYTNMKLESNAQKWVGFKSKENTDPTKQPQLVVETEPDPNCTPDPDPTEPPTPTEPPSGDAWDIAAVGDMNPSGHTDPNGNSGKNGNSIKAALDSGAVDHFIGLGDFQYSIGHCGLSPVSNPSNDHYSKYHVNWGAFKNKTYWTAAPNHDWQPGRNDDLAQYMDGQCVDTVKSATSTDTTRKGPNPAGTFQQDDNWYSFDKGNWHVLVAPSALWRYDPARAQSITSQLDADLAAAKAAGKHLVVVYHEPYFTSKTTSHDRAFDHKPWIDVFWKNRVKILLSGSQHNYERSCPVNNADQCVADGMHQFQVSTGGITLRNFVDNPAYIVKRFSDTWGHLRMSLKADGSYTWNFVPTSGNMANTDSGSRP